MIELFSALFVSNLSSLLLMYSYYKKYTDAYHRNVSLGHAFHRVKRQNAKLKNLK